MNVILSIILCIARAVGGTAQLPAQPESMSRWTIYNLTISNGEQRAPLHEKAVLRGSVSEDAAQLQFHINNGGNDVLPVAAKVDEENIYLSFGSGTRAYSINFDALMEFAEIEEEEIEFLEQGSVFMLDLGRLLALMHDPDQAEKVNAAIDSFSNFHGDAKGAEVEIDGVLYPAQYVKASYNDLNLFENLQEMDQTGIAELDALLKSLSDMLCLMEGVDAEKGYAGLFERFSVDADEMLDTTREVTTMEQDGLRYEKVKTSASDEENKYSTEESIETIERPEGTDHRIQMRNIHDKSRMALNADVRVDGKQDAPEALEMDATLVMEDDLSGPVQWSAEELVFVNILTTSADMHLNCSQVDGQWKTTLEVDGRTTNNRGYEGDMIQEEEPFRMYFECIESEAANGDQVYSYSMDLPVGKDTLSLSFDLLASSEAYADPFEQLPVHELDLADDGSAAQTMLMADAMAFSGNLMLLQAQDDVMAASQVLDNLQRYGEYVEVESIEEAKESFEAPIPDFTPPAGYELDIIEVAADGSCVDCYYWSSTKSEYMVASFYDFRGKARYEGLDEAALEKGPMVHTEVVDGIVNYVDVYTPDVHVYFTVNGISAAEVDRLLDGLDIVSLYMDEAEIAAKQEASHSKL